MGRKAPIATKFHNVRLGGFQQGDPPSNVLLELDALEGPGGVKGRVVFLGLTPRDARALAVRLIQTAEECDKHNEDMRTKWGAK